MGSFPNLVDRAQRYLDAHGGAAEAAELCAHLFGSVGSGPWPALLARVLAADQRFEELAGGSWALRGRQPEPAEAADSGFVALVIRTDGPKPWRHQIVEVAALRVEGGAVVGRWHSPIRPERPRRLPEYLIAAGLGPEELEQAPTFAAAAADLLEFLGDSPLVGLDVALAVAFLQFQLRRVGSAQVANPLLELGPLADLVLGEPSRSRKPELSRLSRRLGLPAHDERRLLGRAQAAAEVAVALLDRAAGLGLGNLAQVRAALDGESPLPSGALTATRPRLLLDTDASQDLPVEPGAYILKDADGQALYVGKARSLRQRLTSYFTTQLERSRRMFGLVEATASVEPVPTGTELEATLLEARLIGRLHPRFNVQRRAGLRLGYIVQRPGRRGTLLRVVSDPVEDAIGPVPSAEARRMLAEARRRFTLTRGRRADRSSRLDLAWQWLLATASDYRFAGGLSPADLRAFAIVVPPAVVEEGSRERAVILGVAGWLGSLDLTRGDASPIVDELRSLLAPRSQRSATTDLELAVALRWLAQPVSSYRIVTPGGQADGWVEEFARRLCESPTP